jgi:hypothetical protein
LKEFQKHGPEIAGYVTAKPVTTRKSKGTKFMEKQGMRDKIKCTAKIKINGISLTLRAD